MEWSHKWAEDYANGLYGDRLLSGRLKDGDLEPQIYGLEYYTVAFKELSTCRQIGMAEGPIPFTAIVEYFNVYPEGDFEDFHYIIRLMDDTRLRLREEDRKRKEKNAEKKTP